MPTPRLDPDRAFTSDDFRAVMSRFVTGVTIVTMPGDDGPHGATVNAFSALSLDPPLVLVCLRQETRSARALKRAGAFSVNILGHEQQALGRYFASVERPTGEAAFRNIAHRTGVTGAPLLDGSIACMECKVAGSFDAGDHTIYVGEVVELSTGADSQPLAFHRGRFLSVA